MNVYITLSKDTLTNSYQLSIEAENERGGFERGNHLAGPKFSGNSQVLHRAKLTARDAAEIRTYLDMVEAEG